MTRRTRQRPPAGGAAAFDNATISSPADAPHPTGHEWRVQWRRSDWSPTTGTKSRRFTRHADLQAFIGRLCGPTRPDLAPVVGLHVTWRHVGPWHDDTRP